MQVRKARIQRTELLQNMLVLRGLVLCVPLVFAMASAVAQGISGSRAGTSGVSTMVLAPPARIDAPQPQLAAIADGADDPPGSLAGVPTDQPGGYRVAPLHTKYILPDERAQSLTAHDKIMIGLEDTYSPLNFGGILVAAGYEQLRNSEPNYGSDRGAFGERLGAAGLRDTTQGLFTDAIFAPLLHEDPRYYVEGDRYNPFHRAVYALTRPVIGRTDSGRKTINGALLLGYVSSTALNNAYYPSVNRNWEDNAKAFGGSLGGSALGFS
jgi:hypothetical protein